MKAEELRKSILQYAVQGKLVPQIDTEEPASILLEKINAKKAEHIKQGKIKKENSLPPISDDEQPFEIPESWEWVRFGDIINFNLGKTPDRKNSVFWNNGTYNWASIADMTDKKGLKETKEKVSEIGLLQFSNGLCSPGTLLMSFKLTIGKVAILECEAVHNEAIISIFPIYDFNDILKSYLFHTLCVLVKYADSTDAIKGATLNSNKIKNMLLALPPLEEQCRIVARIEELMILVDQYEEKQIEFEKLEKEFPDKLKKSILQYAIQAKLVPQIDTEEPASELIKKIKAEKAELIKQGKIKKEKPLPEITDDEKPFEIPDSWEWVRLDDIVNKNIKRGKSPKYASFSNTLVFAQKCNVKTGNTNLSLAQYLDESTLPKYPQDEFMQHNDIVVNSTGNGTMGRVGIFKDSDDSANKRIVPDSHVTIVRTFNLLDSRYIYYYLKSKQSYLESMGDGSTNQTELKPYIIRSLLVPIPPFLEQQRIIARIDELSGLIDLLSSGKKIKLPAKEKDIAEIKVIANNVIAQPMFDIESVGLAARAGDNIDDETINEAKRQVQAFYEKKN